MVFSFQSPHPYTHPLISKLNNFHHKVSFPPPGGGGGGRIIVYNYNAIHPRCIIPVQSGGDNIQMMTEKPLVGGLRRWGASLVF